MLKYIESIGVLGQGIIQNDFQLMKGKVLITDKVHSYLPENLTGIGYDVEYRPKISLIELTDIIQYYSGIIINSKIIADKALIDKADNLRFIGRLGSGLEIIDIPYAESKGISVFNSPEGNRDAVAEHAIGMLLMLFNHLNRANREVKAFEWNREKNRGREIAGQCIGIVGFGNTGQALARKLQGWDVRILAYDKYKNDYTSDFSYVEEASPELIQQHCDIISFHLPLTNETNQLVNSQYLERCKDGVIIVNTSRGKVVNLSDLLFQLSVKKLAGACLDVFENEKFENLSLEGKVILTKLFQLENVVVSPHIAGWTQESLRKIAEVLVEKIKSISI